FIRNLERGMRLTYLKTFLHRGWYATFWDRGLDTPEGLPYNERGRTRAAVVASAAPTGSQQ
ncbi:MAG: hypothetical protein ACP5R5_14975, partial [Armatimonadota bacterium]